MMVVVMMMMVVMAVVVMLLGAGGGAHAVSSWVRRGSRGLPGTGTQPRGWQPAVAHGCGTGTPVTRSGHPVDPNGAPTTGREHRP
jgi:hypothetical protein